MTKTPSTSKGKKSSRTKAATPQKKGEKSPSAKKATAVIQPEIIDELNEQETELDADPSTQFDEESLTPIEIDPDQEVQLEDVQKIAPRAVKAEVVEPDSPSASSKALATTDPIALYLAEIRRYRLLTKEQEQELAIRYRETGDPKAAELLVTSNLRFVVKIAAEYSKFGAKLIDLIQEGNVGLMHAVREFNPYKGVRLITYAVWWIRGYIQEYLMRQYSMVRIGTTQNQRKLFYRLQKEKELLESIGHESGLSSVKLLAGRLGVSEEEVETMSKRLSGRDISLNQPLDSNGTSAATRLDFEASPIEAVDEQLGHYEEIEVLKTNIEKIRGSLSEKELYILENRLLSDEPKTLQEIGDDFGVTREAVRQLEARLIGKIRAAVTESLSAGSAEEDSAE